MAFKKHTKLQLNRSSAHVASSNAANIRTAKLSDFQFNPEPGFLYVTTRAISSRVNANYDGWPPQELRQAYKTFVGRPVYVDHNNWDLKRSRGVIIDAKLYENKLASGHEDVWVELLIEVDANAFPKLAKQIIAGDIDAVSMGADVEYTVCSVCNNQAHDVLQYCGHIPQMKGQEVQVRDKVAGKNIRKLCYEDCYGVSFFEISFVFDPADESALISDVMLASNTTNRSLAHIRQPRETIAAYSQRLGTSLKKVASITTPDFCTTCGSTDLSISRVGSRCRDCGVEKVADKVVMSLPQEVDTLRDELNCPQCGSEWNGMVCLNCGFELPPEGLGDPNTAPGGINLPGAPGEQQEEAPENPGEEAPDKTDSSESDEDEDDKAKSDKNDKAKKKKNGNKEENVSRFDELRKQATLPETIPYRQDTYPGDSAEPYGQSTPEGNQPQGTEPALEPAPAAQAVVQDLDAPDVQNPGDTGNPSEVDVVNQPAGPTTVPGPGPQAGAALNEGGRSASKAEFYLARAAALRERAEEFEKKAETVTVTDVRALDEPPAIDVGPDATVDLLKPTDNSDQLALADAPDSINDGRETGIPDVSDRLPTQVNPFNTVGPYGTMASKSCTDCDEPGCKCENGKCVCKGSKKSSTEVDEATKAAEAKAREDQRVAAAKTRVLRVANFVDERIALGLSRPDEKFAEIAKFEEMDDATLDGYVQASKEFKAKEVRVASKRIPVTASSGEEEGRRMPSLGFVSRLVDVEEDPSDDYLTFISG